MQDEYDDIFVRSESELVPYRPLIHDMFETPLSQLENIQRWETEYGLYVSGAELDRATDQAQGLVWSRNRLRAWVLVPYLKTVGSTFEALWTMASNAQPSSLLLNGIKSDSKHLWLAPGIKHTAGLRWEQINLGAHQEGEGRHVTPVEVRGRESAHAGVLAAAAHHPKWVQAMANGSVPPVWLAGYQVLTDAVGGQVRTPTLGWSAPLGLEGWELAPGGITLAAPWSDARARPYAGPIIIPPPKSMALGAGEQQLALQP